MSREQPKRPSYVPPIPRGTRVAFAGEAFTVVAIRRRKKFAKRYRVEGVGGVRTYARRDQLVELT